jgi:transcriptional regulator with XRE-family HTH domain
MMTSSAFAEWLGGQLRTRRLSQRQLAERSGVSHSTISRILNGTRTPSLGTAARLAKALGHDSVLFAPLPAPDAINRVERALRHDPMMLPTDIGRVMDLYLSLRDRRPEPISREQTVIRRLEQGRAFPRRIS